MAKDPREYGYEGEMVMSQLKGIMNHANQMHDMLKPDTDLPEWVQSKVTLAYDYMQTAADYMATEMNEEVAHSVHVKTYDSQGEKQMNSPEFKKHIEAHGGKLHYASDKGVAFKFASHSHAASFHRGVQSKFRELDSEHDVHEEVQIDELSKDTLKSYLSKTGSGKQYSNPQHFRSSMLSQSTAKAKLGRKTKKNVKVMASEEAAVNAAGAGNVAGLGVGPQGEPGIHMKKKKKNVISFSRFMKK